VINDVEKCIQVNGMRQDVKLMDCDGKKHQHFTFQRDEKGRIAWSGDHHTALKVNHNFLALFWGTEKTTRFKYNPSNPKGSRVRWGHEENKCWSADGKGDVELKASPRCDYFCFVECEHDEPGHEGCYHIESDDGRCLDGSDGKVTLKTCDESNDAQAWRVLEEGRIGLCGNEEMCIHTKGRHLFLEAHEEHGDHNDEHGEDEEHEEWLFAVDGEENPDTSSDPTDPHLEEQHGDDDHDEDDHSESY